MRLLMITRKVNREDTSPAGFTYSWVKKLGEKLDFLYVVVWQKSIRDDLPKNVEIISLPNNKFLRIFALQWRLLKLLPKVDGVFCHQNPEYTILSFLAKIFGKKIVSWYTHKAVNFRRQLMELLADVILTASDKSFRRPLFPEKVIITGHGIDINYFQPAKKELLKKKNNDDFKIISVGRISPIKNYKTLIDVVKLFRLMKKFKVKIIGLPALEGDKEYFKNLKQSVKGLRGLNIEFVGGIPHNQILPYYQDCDLFINLSQTGSLDKAVLEAMACGKMVLTSNEAFIKTIGDYRLLFKSGDLSSLGGRIFFLSSLSKEEKEIISKKLRKIVVENHNLDNLTSKIISQFL